MSEYDMVVIGGGPAGQKAAVQAAKAGARVLLIERARSTGADFVTKRALPFCSLLFGVHS